LCKREHKQRKKEEEEEEENRLVVIVVKGEREEKEQISTNSKSSLISVNDDVHVISNDVLTRIYDDGGNRFHRDVDGDYDAIY
jgi:hypothetical protein